MEARVAQIEAQIKTSGEIKVSMLINLNSSGETAETKGTLAVVDRLKARGGHAAAEGMHSKQLSFQRQYEELRGGVMRS